MAISSGREIGRGHTCDRPRTYEPWPPTGTGEPLRRSRIYGEITARIPPVYARSDLSGSGPGRHLSSGPLRSGHGGPELIPISDSPRTRTTPFVNYAFIAVNLAVFVYALTLSNAVPGTRRQGLEEFREQRDGVCYGFDAAPTDVDRFYCEWALQPREFLDALSGDSDLGGQATLPVLATILTSLFLHAGWLHLLGNMLFLWVFGDNVEDRLGHFGYVLFYALAGIVASLTQVAIDTESVVPVVGASGAVAGVLGAYFLWFPRATVNIIIPFFPFFFIPLPVPAILMIGFWFAQNLVAGYASLGAAAGPEGGVAFFAHIGGFVFGMVTAVLIRGRRHPP
ncbi:MAG: rhomboid family intramembrane serine protease [Dehalococcoidia bacterium]|nr:rhomboid family intramembrane serine protease [Dehalococcoidia bacterium]